MIVPDANLLVKAYDSDSTSWGRAREWWTECLNGTTSVGLTHPLVFVFLRISTMERVFRSPLTLEQATGEDFELSDLSGPVGERPASYVYVRTRQQDRYYA